MLFTAPSTDRFKRKSYSSLPRFYSWIAFCKQIKEGIENQTKTWTEKTRVYAQKPRLKMPSNNSILVLDCPIPACRRTSVWVLPDHCQSRGNPVPDSEKLLRALYMLLNLNIFGFRTLIQIEASSSQEICSLFFHFSNFDISYLINEVKCI